MKPPPLPSAANSRWEYHVMSLDLKFEADASNQLNLHGDQGWELVSITPSDRSMVRVVLKRRKGPKIPLARDTVA